MAIFTRRSASDYLSRPRQVPLKPLNPFEGKRRKGCLCVLSLLEAGQGDGSLIVTTDDRCGFPLAHVERATTRWRLDCRLIAPLPMLKRYPAVDRLVSRFTMKGLVWQLTPKGIHQKHVTELVNSFKNTIQLVILERDSTTDKLSSNRSTIEVIFRRFVSQNGLNIESSLSSIDSDSLSEYKDKITGHKIYEMTQKGKDVVNMTSRERTSKGGEGSNTASRASVSRDSNTQKLDKILNDVSLYLLFRENLRDTYCEENLSFYLDVDEFLKSCKIIIKSNSLLRGNSGGNLDSIKETTASIYGIYNTFLAPGSPCELNIDHLLRNQLVTRITKVVRQDSTIIESLKEVTKLFEEAQLSVFKLIANSVPKFMKSSKYEQTLKTYAFDSIPPRRNNALDAA
ncbi:regulator of G protein signaling domain-containing protein [Leptodontidium sp. MPI-SDFR-AT-0119]|nr:regulator of G protein signaling domain-containing protein [Leptodontidium sp. MPI-SDFR-AT-0119]